MSDNLQKLEEDIRTLANRREGLQGDMFNTLADRVKVIREGLIADTNELEAEVRRMLREAHSPQ